MYIPIFDRDMLYPTGNNLDPGSVHVAVMRPNSQGNLPVLYPLNQTTSLWSIWISCWT